MGLSGFVGNLPDGRVEILAQGPGDAIERFVAWCRVGPPEAVVTNLQPAQCDDSRRYEGFEIVP